MEINHQCIKGGETRSKGTYQETIRKRCLTVAEGEIRVDTDEYSIYER